MPRKIMSLDTDYIVQEYRAGRSAKDIGRELGISNGPVTRVLKERGVAIRGRIEQMRVERARVTPMIIERYATGESSIAIAKSLGMSVANVCHILRAAGVEPRGHVSALTIEDVLPLYETGLPAATVARELGVTFKVVDRILRKNGIAPENRAVHSIPFDVIEPIYETGVSAAALAADMGVAPSVVMRILRENGIEPRNRSEQQRVRMSKASPEELRKLTQAAHDAVRGETQTEEHRCKIAVTRERRQISVSHYERALAALLRQRGLKPICQKAIGRYNCDLAVHPVAVEVFGGGWHWTGLHFERAERRLRYFLDSGWHVLMVHIESRDGPLRAAIADYIMSYIEQARGDPSAIREYRVVRCTGKLLASGRANDDKLSIIPAFTSARDPVTGRYKSVAR